MKSKTLLCLIFLSLAVNAQNWQPINKAWRYNYRFNNANLVTNTILVDSAKAVGADSVFYLNRILLDCDTCHAASFGSEYNCDSCFVLGNQPQFLQRTIIKKTNGIYQFKDTGNIVLPTLASLNTTWLFDSVWNISATVISINIETIIGTTDSVKTILLSSSDTIKLSKNFGITLYPYKYARNKYHRLTGIEELYVGEHVPDFWDFYDFNVGDVFQYQFGSTNPGPPLTLINGNSKKTILTKTITASNIIYKYLEVIGQMLQVSTGGIPPYYNVSYLSSIDTGYYYISTDSINKYYNLQQMPIDDGVTKIYITKDSSENYMLHYGIQQNRWVENGILMPYNDEYYGHELAFYNNYFITVPNVFYGYPNTLTDIGKVYKLGLGATYSLYGYWEGGLDTTLIGYIKNGIQVGTITPDDILLSSKNIAPNQKIKITPNPCSTCYISGIENPNDILVFDILGQSPTQPPLRAGVAGLVIDMDNFSAGIYFVRNLKSGEIIKFVKQ